MTEALLVMDWARFQMHIGRTFHSPQQMLMAYCDETKTGLSVDTPEEMRKAVTGLLRAMRRELEADD